MVKFRIDLDSELQRVLDEPAKNCVLDSVIAELNHFAKKNSATGKEAQLCLRLIDRENFFIQRSPKGEVDDVIVSISDKNALVATNDIELRKRLKSKGIKTIYLRAKKHLAIS